MRKIKAIIYVSIGSIIAWEYWQQGNEMMAALVTIFSILSITLTLSPVGRMRISWNNSGIRLSVFPKKPQNIQWEDLEEITLDHLGYNIVSRTGRFKIKRVIMPNDLLTRIKESIKKNRIISD